MEVISFLSENYVEIFAAIGALLTFANVVAKLTPTQKDDNIIEKIRKFFDKMSDLFLPDVQKE